MTKVPSLNHAEGMGAGPFGRHLALLDVTRDNPYDREDNRRRLWTMLLLWSIDQ